MTNGRRKLKIVLITFAAVAIAAGYLSPAHNEKVIAADPTPTPATDAFDQPAALAKLREQIKGKEKQPAETVFKNIQLPAFKGAPADRVLAVMEMGYARSLGVNCTHCHVPEKWESEEKPQKQIARDMQAMALKISTEMLPAIKNLRSQRPGVNCTTCHRGEIKPALNLGAPR